MTLRIVTLVLAAALPLGGIVLRAKFCWGHVLAKLGSGMIIVGLPLFLMLLSFKGRR